MNFAPKHVLAKAAPAAFLAGFLGATHAGSQSPSEVGTASAVDQQSQMALCGVETDGSPSAVPDAGKVDAGICRNDGGSSPTIAPTDGAADSGPRTQGFTDALELAFPMTPDMIRTYRRHLSETERTAQEQVEPRSLSNAQLVSLDPGTKPPEVMLAPGIATALGIYDASGMPWPIRQYVVGDGEGYQIVQLGENSNTLTISPLRRFGWSNLVIALLGEAQPVVLHLLVTEESAHYRSDIHVTRLGPNASATNATSPWPLARAGDRELLALASGTSFPDATSKLDVQGHPVDAWLEGESVLLRTRHPLLSPAWLDSISGPEGIRAYRLPLQSTLLLAVDDRVVRAELELP